MFSVQLMKSIRFLDTVQLSLEIEPVDPLDLLPGGHLWEKILGYLSDFRDWARSASVCHLFQKTVHKQHWAKVEAFEVCVLEFDEDGEIGKNIPVRIRLKAGAEKKGKGDEAAVCQEVPFSERPLFIQSETVLSGEKSL